MVTLQDFIHRLGSYNHLNVSITDSGSERVNNTRVLEKFIVLPKKFSADLKII